MIDNRICFIGDSFVAGVGDAQCLGWVGRVVQSANKAGHCIAAYNLGIRRDTSDDISARWEEEVGRRFNTDAAHYLVFSFGANDMTIEGGQCRVNAFKSLENFTRIIKAAKARHPTLIMGPCPVGDTGQNARLIELDQSYGDAAKKLGAPYISVINALMKYQLWVDEAKEGDGAHPSCQGYSHLAYLFQNWDQWWFGGGA